MSEPTARPHGWRPTVAPELRGYGTQHRRLRRQVLAEEPDCRKCGDPSEHADHIVPLAMGGPTIRANYQGLCAPCSRRKAAREGGLIRWHGRGGALPILLAREARHGVG